MNALRTVLVDDSPVFLKAARDALNECSRIRIVGEAVSGEAALDVVTDLRPDLVLMDLRMPGIGGLEATRRIKIMGGVDVAMVTVETAEEYRDAAMQAGACDFIEKRAIRKGVELLTARLTGSADSTKEGR